jgi:hypothetical protein
MTDAEKRKVSTKDAKVGGSLTQTKSVGVSATSTDVPGQRPSYLTDSQGSIVQNSISAK